MVFLITIKITPDKYLNWTVTPGRTGRRCRDFFQDFYGDSPVRYYSISAQSWSGGQEPARRRPLKIKTGVHGNEAVFFSVLEVCSEKSAPTERTDGFTHAMRPQLPDDRIIVKVTGR